MQVAVRCTVDDDVFSVCFCSSLTGVQVRKRGKAGCARI